MEGMDDEVLTTLQAVGIKTKYGKLFASQDLDYESFLTLTSEEMKEMGVPIGPRKRLQRYLSNKKVPIKTIAPTGGLNALRVMVNL
jgi:hypothetical protein